MVGPILRNSTCVTNEFSSSNARFVVDCNLASAGVKGGTAGDVTVFFFWAKDKEGINRQSNSKFFMVKSMYGVENTRKELHGYKSKRKEQHNPVLILPETAYAV